MSHIRPSLGLFVLSAFCLTQTGCVSKEQEPPGNGYPISGGTISYPQSSGIGGGGGTLITGSSGVSGVMAGSQAAGSGGISAETGGTVPLGTVPSTVCGNRIIESGEQCEIGLALNATCESLGKGIGQLTCNTSCYYDYSGCIEPTNLFTVNADISSAIGTVGIVTWSISVPITEAYIEFGLDTNYGMQAPVDLAEPQYRTLLLGMKGEREYHFRIVAKSADSEYKSDDYTIITGPVTNLAQVREMNVVNEAARAGGFYVTSVWQSPNPVSIINTGGLAIILDADGDVVWWWLSDHLGNLSCSRISYDGKNMWMVGIGEDGLDRVTMDGLDYQHYDVRATHDIFPVTGDVIAFVAEEWFTCGATIEEITPSGITNVVFDTTPVLRGSCHGNAIRYNEKSGLYIYSDMMQPDVLIIDRATGSLLHQLRNFQGYWSSRQHGLHYFGNTLLVFQNDLNFAQEYIIDTNTKQLTPTWSYTAPFASVYLGDVQRLPNGNTAVTYSIPGRLHEVDANENLVMEMVFNASIGYSSWRPSLYGPPEDIMMQ